MKTTEYFKSVRTRPDRKIILDEWIERVMENPIAEVVQQDHRIRRWGVVPEVADRILRVVLLSDGETVHNAFFDRSFQKGHKMRVQFFEETDTLYIVFKEAGVDESKDLDENTLVEFDAGGNLVSMTIEHARERADVPNFSFQQVLRTGHQQGR